MEEFFKSIAALDERWWASATIIYILVIAIGGGIGLRSWTATARAVRRFVVMSLTAFKPTQVLKKDINLNERKDRQMKTNYSLANPNAHDISTEGTPPDPWGRAWDLRVNIEVHEVQESDIIEEIVVPSAIII